MTIIGIDGRAVKFCGDDDGNVIVDRRVADRRVFDHITPERREDDRRKPAPEPRPVVVQNTKMRISSHVSERDLNAKLDAFMDALLDAATKRSLSDAEALAALSTEAALKFADSQPCWMKEEEQCFQATASS